MLDLFNIKIGGRFAPLMDLTDVVEITDTFTDIMKTTALEVWGKARKMKQTGVTPEIMGKCDKQKETLRN